MTTLDEIALEQKLALYDGEDRVESAQTVLDLYRKDRPQAEPIKSNLPTFDRVIGGFYTGQLIVISGITGQGKTTLCQTFTRAFTDQLVWSLWFSFEVSTDDFINVFPGDYKEHVFMPLKLKGNTLNWLEERIIEAKLKHSVKVVFVDHLHYLVSMAPKSNQSFIIGETVRGLKQLALKHCVVIFLVAHMMKTRPDEEPGLGHIRDSSFVEQEADTVLYVWRMADNKHVTACKIAKNRKRGVIDARIPLILVDGRYQEKVE
jgi:replicative DNA helicase